MDEHLSQLDLERYHAAQGSAQQLRRASGHLQSCQRCRRRLEGLLADHELLHDMQAAAVVDVRSVPPPPSGLPAAEPADVQHIRGYEIQREIGRGAQGVVFEATEQSTRRRVALKVMHEGLFADPRRRARFEAEIGLAGSLRHPHIVVIYGSGLVDGHFYYVMEYVDGVPLGEYVRPRLPAVLQRVQLFRKICGAVRYAHEHGVIHLDLKPSNIAVDSGGEPRLLDFGLARRSAGAAPGAGGLGATAGFIGTLPYAAPEQLAGAGPALDSRSDVYALGVIGYELLTGARPYPDTDNPREMIGTLKQLEPHAPALLDRRIDRDLQAILLKALSKSPDERYASAGHLDDDLGRYLNHQTVQARRPTPLYLGAKILARHRGKVAMAAAVFVFCAGLGLWSFCRIAAERNRAVAAGVREAEARQVEADVRRALEEILVSANAEFHGQEPTVRQLLERAAQLLQASSAGRPAELQEQVATALERMSANLGAHALIDIETSAPTGEEALPEEEPVTRISVGTAASAHAGFTALKLAQEAWPWLPAAAPQQPAAEAAPVQELAVAVQEVQPAAEPARTAAAHGRRLTGMLRNQLTDHAFSDYIFAVDGCLHPRNHLEVLQPDGDLLSHDILRRAFAREQGWFSMKDSRQSAEAQADQREREMAAVRARILEHWPQADGNADGMLDQNEVVALYQQHLAERARSFLSEHPDSDLDQDGQLEEFEIIAQARKVRHQRMQARLAGRPDLDLDGDGLPSVAEYVEYLKRRADERKSRARDEQRTLCCAMRAGRLANLPGGAAVCESGLCCSAFFQVTCDDFESGRLEIDDILDEFELLDPRNNEKSGCLKRLGQLPDDRPPEMPDFKIRPQLSPFHVQGQR